MIDIHAHILPFVDDGSPDLDNSLKLLDQAEAMGITDIILTPHGLRNNLPHHSKEVLQNAFIKFQEHTKNYQVKLHLGQEISWHRDLLHHLKEKDLIPLANSKYLLLELPFEEALEDLEEKIYNLRTLGYEIIIAHIECYNYLDFKDILAYSELPISFQVNSGSITGRNGKVSRKLAFKLLRHRLVKYVASDIHSFREYDLDKAYQIVKDKFGLAYANEIFIDNPKWIINN